MLNLRHLITICVKVKISFWVTQIKLQNVDLNNLKQHRLQQKKITAFIAEVSDWQSLTDNWTRGPPNARRKWWPARTTRTNSDRPWTRTSSAAASSSKRRPRDARSRPSSSNGARTASRRSRSSWPATRPTRRPRAARAGLKPVRRRRRSWVRPETIRPSRLGRFKMTPEATSKSSHTSKSTACAVVHLTFTHIFYLMLPYWTHRQSVQKTSRVDVRTMLNQTLNVRFAVSRLKAFVNQTEPRNKQSCLSFVRVRTLLKTSQSLTG